MSDTFETIKTAVLQWDEAQQPHSVEFDDCYFSAVNGLEESEYVFLQGNKLPQRWQQHTDSTFTIGETGFGSGLNFITAWQLWQENTSPSQHLYFVSAEKHPLSLADLKKAASLWPQHQHLYQRLIEQYPTLIPGYHLIHFENVHLLLMLGEAEECFTQLLESDHPAFNTIYGSKMDAWFLDGFAPAKNPELWNEKLFHSIANLSRTGTTLATFTVAGIVKRGLRDKGFSISKSKGFAHKRDMLVAEFTAQEPDNSFFSKPEKFKSDYMAPWYLNERYINDEHINKNHINNTDKTKSIAIIGAGIAGCTLANSLAKKGIAVTIFDEQPAAATQTSGNRQGILYNKFSHKKNMLSEFSLNAYLYALNFYRQLKTQDSSLLIDLCGVLQVSCSEKDSALFRTLKETFSGYENLIQFLDSNQSTLHSGVDINSESLFFPQAGWINPADVCQHLLDHPNIKFIPDTSIDELQQEGTSWLFKSGKQTIHKSQTTIIAGGPLSHRYESTVTIPYKNIRGQVSHLPATEYSSQLKAVLCGEGYIAPEHESIHSLGATYNFDDNSDELSQQDHDTNLQSLKLCSETLASQWQHNKIDQGKVGFRATTPDYLPLCGPIPNHELFLGRYGELRKNAKANIPACGPYYPGLYLFSGLGSRGMTYAPLCAELLCSQLLNSPSPLPRRLSQSLSPARFIIRDLIKKKL